MGVRRRGLLSQPIFKLLAKRRGRKEAKAQAAALATNRSRFEAQQGDGCVCYIIVCLYPITGNTDC